DRSHFSNTDSVFGRVHERFPAVNAAHLWKVYPPSRNASPARTYSGAGIFIWASRCGRQPRFRRSRKQDQFRLRYEPNGTIGFAEREIASARRRDVRVALLLRNFFYYRG